MRSIIFLAVAYFVSAKLGLELAVANQYVTAIWPPTGIALGALLIWGGELWPGVWIGAFLANLSIGEAITLNAALASAGIATGNTVEAILGAYLVNRYAGGRLVFERATGIFRFAALAALGSTLVSATVGIASLLLAGLASPANIVPNWLTWWIGDASGALVCAPALMLWAADWRFHRSRMLEAGLLLLSLSILSVCAFTTLLPPVRADLGLTFLCTPPLLWAAFRFGRRESAAAMLFVSVVAIWGWHGAPLSGDLSPANAVLEMQSFLGVMSVTVLAVAAEVAQRRQHEQTLERIASIVESSEDAILSKSLDGTITSWNSGAERIYGYSASEVLGRPISILAPSGREAEVLTIIERIRRGEKVDHFETRRMRKDGSVIDVSVTVSPIRGRSGKITGASIVARDITDRKRLAEQLFQTRKLEGIAMLAGGVAHDFNNQLTCILGNASLARDLISAEHPARGKLHEVIRASEAAAARVQQLLAFAGKGQFFVQPVRMQEVVRETASLVQSSFSKRIDLRLDLAEAPAVAGDINQLRQLVRDLLINAAEAIGDSPGSIGIAVHEIHVDGANVPGLPAGQEIAPGGYTAVAVRDTGCGIDQETRSRIFDPFFTTKFTGRGLGLAAVLGIVRGLNGAIRVDSSPGNGTTFEVLLPALAQPSGSLGPPPGRTQILGDKSVSGGEYPSAASGNFSARISA